MRGAFDRCLMIDATRLAHDTIAFLCQRAVPRGRGAVPACRSARGGGGSVRCAKRVRACSLVSASERKERATTRAEMIHMRAARVRALLFLSLFHHLMPHTIMNTIHLIEHSLLSPVFITINMPDVC